jgi:hypothetical protein
MLESNGSDYFSGDDACMWSIPTCLRNVGRHKLPMRHRNPQDHDFKSTSLKTYHHYTVVRVVWHLKNRVLVEYINGESGALQLSE